MLNELDAETTEEPGADDTTSTGDEATDESTDTSSASDQDDGGTQDDESSDTEPEILTAEEQALLDNYEDGTQKEVNDIKSQHGRDIKIAKQREQELLGIIDKLSTPSDNGKEENDDQGEKEPDLYTPTQPWENEDGTLNLDGMSEWNYRALQQHQETLKKINKQLESFGININDIQSSSQEQQEAAEWGKKHGISEDDFRHYKTIQKDKGEMAGFEYLTLKRKLVDGQKAAQAHREKERGNTPVTMTPGAAPVAARADGNVVTTEAERISKMKYGENRTTALSSLHDKYPTDVASAIIRQVVVNG